MYNRYPEEIAIPTEEIGNTAWGNRFWKDLLLAGGKFVLESHVIVFFVGQVMLYGTLHSLRNTMVYYMHYKTHAYTQTLKTFSWC